MAWCICTFDTLCLSLSVCLSVCSDLKLARDKLLNYLRVPEKTVEEVQEVADIYFGLLLGLIKAPSGSDESKSATPTPKPAEGEESAEAKAEAKAEDAPSPVPAGESKLRKLLLFKWTDTLHGKEAR